MFCCVCQQGLSTWLVPAPDLFKKDANPTFTCWLDVPDELREPAFGGTGDATASGRRRPVLCLVFGGMPCNIVQVCLTQATHQHLSREGVMWLIIDHKSFCSPMRRQDKYQMIVMCMYTSGCMIMRTCTSLSLSLSIYIYRIELDHFLRVESCMFGISCPSAATQTGAKHRQVTMARFSNLLLPLNV